MKTFDKKALYSWSNCKDAQSYIGSLGLFSNSLDDLSSNSKNFLELSAIDTNSAVCFKPKDSTVSYAFRSGRIMHEYVSISDFIADIKDFMPQWDSYTVDIFFYDTDKNGDYVQHPIWQGILKDCNPYNPVFKNYKYLWNDDLSVYGKQTIDICCERVEE